ncbi:acyl-CoA dehydrogenase family protein [Mycobacterium sp. AZCC_0083]|uniref:acyl-CoA dehydrogenase family protein n=1 Tax=Mycobacterium sp. AZCC_0083 TaxID=2735882 RepID=UPI00161F3CB6|nr:acyl-CoA dehydrogenase family protein [Mycobacterium sp. AZCC_0083]MBB5163139.1 alkylation response protein AidB-like acyl-CoA dehydrogenase [Mycobacterium sp. AZCC_0083]
MTISADRQALPTRTDLVGRAVALQPLLREHAGAGDADRRQADAVIAGLTEAGLFRLFTPSRFGGFETDLRTVLEVTEALGEADGSAAWLVSVASVAAWMTGFASAQAQQDIFGPDSDARIAGGSAPAPARRVSGGLRVSGRWAYASGSHHATWASLGAMVSDDAGNPVDAVLCLAPAADLQLEDTWRTVGMRGTGSNTWIADDVFVPTHRIISMGALAAGELTPETDEVMYRMPFVPLATLPLLGPLLGLGRAVLALTVHEAPRKAMHHTFFARQSDSVGVQVQIAQAALMLDTARLHAHHCADELDATAARGEQTDYATRARVRATAGYAAQQVLDAINILINVHGAASFAESSRLQQFWRDANTAARHAGLNVAVGYEILGKDLLGIDEPISPMV